MQERWPPEVTLRGEHVVLEPLRAAHASGVSAAAADGALWTLWYTGGIPAPGAAAAEIERRLQLRATGTMLPFVVLDTRSGETIGMTTYMNVVAEHRRVEIGSTWYRASRQRTAVNTECKLLLLRHAFEVLACIAVEFRTSSFNRKSRAAIERLGAKLDGVLRSHQIVRDDIVRDTYVYSITAAEWPGVRENLRARLHRPEDSVRS